MFNFLSILIDVIALATFQRRPPQHRANKVDVSAPCENMMRKG